MAHPLRRNGAALGDQEALRGEKPTTAEKAPSPGSITTSVTKRTLCSNGELSPCHDRASRHLPPPCARTACTLPASRQGVEPAVPALRKRQTERLRCECRVPAATLVLGRPASPPCCVRPPPAPGLGPQHASPYRASLSATGIFLLARCCVLPETSV